MEIPWESDYPDSMLRYAIISFEVSIYIILFLHTFRIQREKKRTSPFGSQSVWMCARLQAHQGVIAQIKWNYKQFPDELSSCNIVFEPQNIVLQI